MEILYAKWLFDGKELQTQQGCVVSNNKVIDLLPISIAKKIYKEASLKDYGEGVLFSGFVNAHTHLELSHTKIEPYLGFVNWLKAMIESKKQVVSQDVDKAIKDAISVQLENGVCAVADITNTLESVKHLSKIPHKVVFFENYSLSRAIAQEKIDFIKNNIDYIRKKYNARIYATAHSVYSTHSDLLKFTLLENNTISGDLFSLHFLESEFEDLFVNSTGALFEMLAKKGLVEENLYFASAMEYLKSLGKLKRGLFVHCVYIKPDEIEYLKSIGSSIVISARSNYYISKMLPNLDLIKKSNTNVAVGTDSLASNWDLSILNELRFLRKHFLHIEPNYFFHIATLGGYRALNLNIGFNKGSFVYPFFIPTKTNDALEEILQ